MWVAFDYLSVDRDQLFLLPHSMRDWLPDNHLVWVVIDVVEQLDLSILDELYQLGGVGRRAHDPAMMLTVLFYAYCTGERSSRRIEQLCETDIAYRVACAGVVADHTTIARFRVRCGDALQALFVELLAICGRAGLLDSGLIAVDGTKMAGSASSSANRSQAQIDAELEQIATRVLAEADTADSAAGTSDVARRWRGLEHDGRRERLQAAAGALAAARAREDERGAARDAATDAVAEAAAARGHLVKGRPRQGRELAKAEARLQREIERAAQHDHDITQRAAERGDNRLGAPRKHPAGLNVAKAEKNLAAVKARLAERTTANSTDNHSTDNHSTDNDTRDNNSTANHSDGGIAKGEAKPSTSNVTDPDSRILKTTKGWVQGYNPQAALNGQGIVVAAALTNDHTDYGQAIPMMALIGANLNAAGAHTLSPTVLFDAGYWSEENIESPGPDRLIADTRRWKLARTEQTNGPPPADANPVDAMKHRIRTPEGAATYKQRSHIAETLFGAIKHNRKIRYFVLRGLEKVKTEWTLICMTHNINKHATHAR